MIDMHFVSLDMLPRATTNDVAGIALANAVIFRQFFCALAIRVPLAHFTHLNVCHFTVGRLFALWLKAATLGVHIPHIVRMGAEKQMIWVGASRIVAFVANLHAFWSRAKMKHPRNAMDCHCPFVYADLAVSIAIQGANPVPTFIGAVIDDFFPETLFEGDCLSDVMPLQKLNGLPFYVPAFLVILFCNWGKLTTTTVAVTIGNFLRGHVHGILEHSRFSFQNLLKPQDISRCRCGNSIGVIQEYFSTCGL